MNCIFSNIAWPHPICSVRHFLADLRRNVNSWNVSRRNGNVRMFVVLKVTRRRRKKIGLREKTGKKKRARKKTTNKLVEGREIFAWKVSTVQHPISIFKHCFFCFICAYVLSGCSFAARLLLLMLILVSFFPSVVARCFPFCRFVPGILSQLCHCYFRRFVVCFGLFRAFILYSARCLVIVKNFEMWKKHRQRAWRVTRNGKEGDEIAAHEFSYIRWWFWFGFSHFAVPISRQHDIGPLWAPVEDTHTNICVHVYICFGT